METSKREGITIAGNIVADVVKDIEIYPAVGALSSIRRVTRGVGGSVPNVGIDLARIDPELPLYGLGCVGKDDYGRFILEELTKHRINTDGIAVLEDANTSFSDVMSLPTGDRTFFHLRGANALFSPDHIDLDKLRTPILHVAYILLLDRFDEKDAEYGTVMARFLHDVQQRGIRTSVDMITSSAGGYSETVVPALRYSDYFVVNENECCAIWGIDPRRADGTLDLTNLKRAMQLCLDRGVGEKVIVHAKELCACLTRGGGFTLVPSLDLPESFIRGSVGAGDAFCAGALYSLYKGMDDREMLLFASAAAAMSLKSENAVDGMGSKAEIDALSRRFPRKKLGEGMA
ncbi:MAG: carbohydrate kinase family protein [Clostridia bacterium]|nr:carbohydrate kinase family protein [Clostridia bacterium]